MAGLFKRLASRQSGGPCREDVIHEPDRGEGGCWVVRTGPERADQVRLALASVQMVLAQPDTGSLQQVCCWSVQAHGNALRQAVDALPFPAWNRHQHRCGRQAQAVRQHLNQRRKCVLFGWLTHLQQQLAQGALIWPKRAPSQGLEALDAIRRKLKCVSAVSAGRCRSLWLLPRSITDRATGLDQQGLGEGQERSMHSGKLGASSVPLLNQIVPCLAVLLGHRPKHGHQRAMGVFAVGEGVIESDADARAIHL